MKCLDIIRELEKLAPESLALDWDNSGLLLGRTDKNISRILIALEVNETVVEMAVSGKADLLITHHPMIFKPLKRLSSENAEGRYTMRLLRADICCYAMHTNFDMAQMGMGTLAADKLGLVEQRILGDIVPYRDFSGNECLGGLGKIGQLKEPLNAEGLCALIDREFANSGIRMYVPSGKKDRLISQVAVLPGSGGDYVDLAAESGADAFITGDVSHHEGTAGTAQGLMVFDAGHYCLEYPFTDYLERYLMDRVSSDVDLVTVPFDPPCAVWKGGR